MSENKPTRFSQVVAATALVMRDLERFIHTDSNEDLEHLKQSIEDFHIVVEAFKKNPIHD